MKKYLAFLITFVIIILYMINKEQQPVIPHYQKHLGSTNHIVAHRGFSSLKYENSYESIKLANESPCVDAIEIDVRLTNDGYLVLSHNNKIVLSSKNKFKVSNITYNDFMSKELIKPIPDDININKFNKIPDLKIDNRYGTATNLYEVIKIANKKTLVIDIKYNKNIKVLNKIILDVVKDRQNIILQSNNIEAIRDLKSKAPNNRYQYIIDSPEDVYNVTDDLYGVSIRYNLINYSLVNNLLNRGIKVFTWTINDTETYKKIIEETKENSNKIYYVTDYPDILCNYDIRKFKLI